MERNNRNRHLDGTASIFLLPLHALVLVFGAADSGQPTLQLRDCGVICALGSSRDLVVCEAGVGGLEEGEASFL